MDPSHESALVVLVPVFNPLLPLLGSVKHILAVGPSVLRAKGRRDLFEADQILALGAIVTIPIFLTQVLDRTNAVRCATSGWIAGMICVAVDPTPMRPTRLPARSRLSGQFAECTRGPLKE